MLITQGALPHICELDGSLGTRIHEPVATQGVKFGRRDHLGQLLHVGGFDINDIETLILNIQIP